MRILGAEVLHISTGPEPLADGEHDVTGGQFELDPTAVESAARFGFDLARRVDQDVAQALNQRATGA